MKPNTQATNGSGTATTSFAQVAPYSGTRDYALIQNKGPEDLYITVTDPNETPDINLANILVAGAVWEPYRAPVGIISVATSTATASYVTLIS